MSDYQAATDFLANIDIDWMQLIARVGPCTLQTKSASEPYEALIRAVAYQQLHAKAGDAILGRLLSQFGQQFPTPQQLLTTNFDTLRACGFSAKKIESLKGVATATLNGVIPSLAEAERMTDDALIAQLIMLKGVGRWTVEMMLIFTLGRTDVLPADDFGVAEGYMRLKKLQCRPTPKKIREIGEQWTPYRSIATWYLWRAPKV